MTENEIRLMLADNSNHSLRTALRGLSAEQIDEVTAEIMAYANSVKMEYHWLKGEIVRWLRDEEFSLCLINVKKDADHCLSPDFNVFELKMEGDYRIESGSVNEAVKTACKELNGLRGMMNVFRHFADGASSYAAIYMQTLYDFKFDAMTLPDSMIGKKDENGNWDIPSCRNSFVGMLLFLMDEADAQAVPFRSPWVSKR